MKIKLLLAAALTLLPGFADTVTLQWDAAPMVDPASGQRGGGGDAVFSGPLSLPPFDPTLGTLTSVSVSVDAVFGLIFEPFSEKLNGALYPMVLPTAASMSLQMGPQTLVCSAQQNSDLGQWLAVIYRSPVGTAPSPPLNCSGAFPDDATLRTLAGPVQVNASYSLSAGNIFRPELWPNGTLRLSGNVTYTYQRALAVASRVTSSED